MIRDLPVSSFRMMSVTISSLTDFLLKPVMRGAEVDHVHAVAKGIELVIEIVIVIVIGSATATATGNVTEIGTGETVKGTVTAIAIVIGIVRGTETETETATERGIGIVIGIGIGEAVETGATRRDEIDGIGLAVVAGVEAGKWG